MRRRPGTTTTTTTTRATITGKGRNNVAQEPLLDEDDQDAMIRQLQIESDRLQQKMHQGFSILCLAVAVVCLLVTVYISLIITTTTTTTNNQQDKVTNNVLIQIVRWLHCAVAVVVHWQAKCLVSSLEEPIFSWKRLGPGAVLATGSVLLTAFWTTMTTDSNFHSQRLHYWGLTGSCVVVLLGAILLRLDSDSTRTALTDLQTAKYRYKSL
jgi:hypothetical protein